MGEFVQELLEHVRRTTGRLEEAQAAGDDYSEAVLQGELEGLQRLADEHDVVLSLPASDADTDVIDLTGDTAPATPA